MILSEMLEYTASQFLDDRTDLVDGSGDSLWSDEYLVRQFNEGQRKLARASWCIIETGVAPASVITLATGVSLYALHKAVLYVWDVTPSTQASPLGNGDDSDLRDTNTLTRRTDDIFDAVEIGMASALAGGNTVLSGAPLAFAVDAGFREARVFPPPTATQNGLVLNLKIARLPVTWLTLDNTDGEPEVPEDFHLAVCEYAAGKALTLPNVDGQQKADGRLLLSGFNDVMREARQDRQRLQMTPSRWRFASATAVLR